jgi:hypothetical protein
VNSSWIEFTKYKRLPDGSSYLAVFLKDQPETVQDWNSMAHPAGRSEPVAFLYGGPTSPVPSWLPGLLQAGTGRRSVGLAFNRLLKGKYTYQRVEGREQVEQLKEMMS